MLPSIHRRVEQWRDGSGPVVELWQGGRPAPVLAPELARACCSWAATLADERHEVVGVVGRPGLRAYAAYLGALLAGKTPAFIPYSSERLGPAAFGERMADLRRILGDAVYVGAEVDGSGSHGIRMLHEPAIDTRVVPPEPARPLRFIQCSSGTTGRQKSVLVPWPSLEVQLRAYAKAIALRPDDRIVSWLPVYHDMGLIACLIMPLLWGVPLHVLDPFEWAREPRMLLEVIEAVGGTICFMPNFAYALLARQPPGPDLSSVRLFVNSGEPPTHRAISSFAARHNVPASRVRTSYGLAENVFAVTQSVDDGPPVALDVDAEALGHGRVVPRPEGGLRILSSGVPLEGMEVAIDAAAGKDVGSILVRSPCRVDGYLDGTKLVGDWLPTGDLGFVERGHLFVCGRDKALIIVDGRNLFPTDIEEAVAENVRIAPGRFVAVGVPSALDTESLLVLAEPSEPLGVAESAALAEEVATLVERRFATPARVEIVPRRWLVKTTSGKLARGANLRNYQRAGARTIHLVGDSTVRGLGDRYRNLRSYWVGVLWSGDLGKFLPWIEQLLATADDDDVLVIVTGEPECRVALPAAADPDEHIARAMAAYSEFFAALSKRWAGRLVVMTGIPTNAVTIGPSAPDPSTWPERGWLPPISTPRRRYQLQRRFYAALRSVCEGLGLGFIDACTPLVTEGEHFELGYLDGDGIHLDYEHQQLLCDWIHARLGFLGAPLRSHATAPWDGTRAGFERLLAAKLRQMARVEVPLEAIFSSSLLGSLSLVELVDFLSSTFGVSVDLTEDLVSDRFDSAERIYTSFIATGGAPQSPARPRLPSYSGFSVQFAAHFGPKLGHRRHSFQNIFEALEHGTVSSPVIVETGTSDLTSSEFLAQGRSTEMFDAFVRHCGGTLHSVDISPRPGLRSRFGLGPRTHLWCEDSVRFLARYADAAPIDLLYLDSLDIDWDDPHPSALHHARELCAALPKLRPGALVVVDDNDEHELGKGGYIHELMEQLGARKLFDRYQVGWSLPERIVALRAWGNETQVEREVAAELAGQRWFRYERVGHDLRILELLQSGTIGAGRSRCEELWFVQERDDGALELVLTGRGRVTCRLRRDHEGWGGRWRIFERMPVRLSAAPTMASRSEAEKLHGHGRYRYVRVGLDERVLELGPAGGIVHGMAAAERLWSLVHDPGGALVLELHGDAGTTCRLAPHGDGRWAGEWLTHERAKVELRPLTAPTAAEVRASAQLLRSASPVFITVADATHCVRLEPKGDVGLGARLGAETWRTELVDGVVELRMASAGEDRLWFRARSDGTWRGARVDQCMATLAPWCEPARDITPLVGCAFRYVREGHDERPMSFSPHGWIDLGSSRCERAWKLVEHDDGVELELWGSTGRTVRLRPHEHRWLGRWEIGERMGVQLEPLPLPGPPANWVFFELMMQRLFNYRREGHEERVLELRRDQSIGIGQGACEQLWRVELVEGTTVLVISGAGHETCRLRRRDDGTWHGRWLVHERMPVTLSPVS
jgi:fatty-acyl-CoA synthase